MFKKLLNYIHDLSIVYKLFLTYIIILSVPIVLFIIINNNITSRDTENQIKYSSLQALSQTNSFLQYNINSVTDLLDIISFNSSIQRLMNTKTNSYEGNIGQWYRDEDEIRDIIYRLPKSSSISGIYVYMRYGLSDFSESDILLSLKKYDNSPWIKLLNSSGNMSQWFPGSYFSTNKDGDNFVSIVKKIPNSDNLSEIIGVVRIDIPQPVIKSILDKASVTKSSSVIIFNSKNEIISASDGNKYTDTQEISDTIGSLHLNNIDDNSWNTLTLNKEKVLLGVQNIKKTDWKVLLVVPYTDITELNTKSKKQLILIFLILVPLMLPVAFLVSTSATKRISRLNRNMKKVEEGNIDIIIKPKNNDEIGQLINNYNRMLSKLELLMKDQYKLGRKVKSFELKALQAQINPHFLYNTLDLINWMSVKYKIPQIGSVVENLSKFYRLSLSKGEDIVSIKNELDHVSAYVQIQNMRHGNNINFEVNVPEELIEYSILKITLQPIVENSIHHGIMEKDSESGTIRISGEISNNIIILKIEDDGVGMDEYHVDNILTGCLSKSSSGFGIKNINERIVLNYGDEFGLTYSSSPGKGTTVLIRIPALKKDH